jgi:hypothetical protein
MRHGKSITLFVTFFCQGTQILMEEASRKRGRDQSQIQQRWWQNQRRIVEENALLKQDRDRLLQEAEEVRKELCASRRKARKLIMGQAKDRETICSLQRAIEEKSQTIATLQGSIEDKADEHASIASVIHPLERYGGLQKISDRPTLVAAAGSVIIAVMSVLMRKTMPLSRLRVVCDALFHNCIFGVDVTKSMLSEIYKKFFFHEQRSVFSPWKVLRAIDLSSVGGLNYNGLETLRNVEELERYQRGVLPSRSSVQRASYELHRIGQSLVPFEKKVCAIGEMYEFNYERYLRFILKIFQLEVIAQFESVELSITLDGAELCDGISHLTAGIKVTDARAIDPRDGSPLCMTMDEMMGRMFHNQSRNNCFALKSLIGKDCKKAYKEFADFFQFFEVVKRYGLAASELGPSIMAMDIWSPQDLSSVWKCLSTGSGARKNGKTHFCHLCACCGDNIIRFLVGDNRYNLLFIFAINLC